VAAIDRGDLPQVPTLFATNLLPVAKPQGGVRPIAVSEVWYQPACLCALTACPAVGPA
jgi:hypothetical protein